MKYNTGDDTTGEFACYANKWKTEKKLQLNSLPAAAIRSPQN